VKNPIASYQSIALDIAKRIMEEEFPAGTKLSGRTLLASQYNVSPETIRKAVALLKEANVLTVSQGKEIVILSSQQAQRFIKHRNETASAYSLRQELEMLLHKKEDNDRYFHRIVTEIIRYSDRLKNLVPYNPVEVFVPQDSSMAGKSVKEMNLWHNTGATIVAIRRGVEIIISPGPNAVLQAGDRLVVVGGEDVLVKVTDFIR
jgi:K+/H+ antiporter YhaU regulatory subunit KhtT